MKIARITTQSVAAALKAAGFQGSINTRSQRRSGFHVTKRNAFVVGVTFYDWEGTGNAWPAILAGLTASEWTIAHGFGPDMVMGAEALAIARTSGACLLVKTTC